jgi:prepilin-type processing-associated H-X9-DG protein
LNPKAALASDRACIPGGRIGDNYNNISSILTPEGADYWGGNVGFADGSASFEYDATADTQYGSGPDVETDRLFTRHKDSASNIDQLTDPDAAWDDTANALLGYTSVGYEDGDIASE